MEDYCFDEDCFEDNEVELMASSLLQSSLRRTPKIYSFFSGVPHNQHPGLLLGAGCCLLAALLHWVAARREGGAVLAPMTSILLFVFWMSWYQYFSGDPFDAFVESMTYCPPSVPLKGHCPVGSSLFEGRCVPEPASSANWSLSAHCSDKNFVVGRAARINGLNASTSAAVGMLAVIFSSSCMERMGRKPVLVFFLVASIVVKLLLSVSCFVAWESFVAIIVVQNIVEIASATPVYPALNCMIADLSQENQQVRGECYASLEAAKNVASLLALLSGYPVLRAHLTNYLPFWASLAGVSVVATLMFSWALPETLQPSKAKEVEASVSLPVLLWRSLTEGLSSCFADVFLGQFLVIWGLINLAVNGAWGLSTMYLQSFLGVEQANASLCRAVWFFALFAGASLSAPLTKYCGAAPVFAAAVSVMASSWFLCGLGGICPAVAQRLFWIFGVGTFGVAYGVSTPCFGVLVAAAAATPSVAFGASVVVGTLLGMPFGPMWSQFLFDPSSTGLHAGAPWLVSASLLAVSCAWFLAISHHCFAQPREAA
eukprot:CAMPEP_0181457508 /NCGR_PEP_ID=MMETSP1110-20121109/31822_1 /TAXON_ID=174948 /ORGANISM="Symbiodinium sp., Strain CCMP421" /LENGTH=541 /DNA_ID=CAMNT_0023581951 /DNA_START=15 /DNA_END=1640 /DNA_ORIENTATION=+